MKTLKDLLFIALLSVSIASGYYFVTNLIEQSNDTTVIQEIIDAIKVIDSLDTVWVDEDNDENVIIWGYGAVTNIDHSTKDLSAYWFNYDTVIGLEIEYSVNFITKKISITDMTITYINLKTKTYVEVNWYSAGTRYNYDGTVQQFRDYLLTLTANDLHKLLMNNKLLDK